MVVSQVVGRIVAVLVLLVVGVLLFKTFFVIEKRNPMNILTVDKLDDEIISKLVMEYYRRKDACPEIEEKVEIVDAGPEYPGQKTRRISVVDSFNPKTLYKFKTGEAVTHPSRPIFTCPDIQISTIVSWLTDNNLIKHHDKHAITEDIQQKIKNSENFELQEFLNKEIFHNKPGYFFEYRAHHKDVHNLATIHLESNLGWSGFRLDPRYGSNETIHGGEAYSAGCLREDDNIIGHYKFFNKDQVFDAENAGVSEYEPVTVLSRTSKGAKFQCYPLRAYLGALNRDSVDLLVLNSFGTELDILRNADLSNTNVKVVAVKSHKETEDKNYPIRDLMKKEGYRHIESPSSINYTIFHKTK